MADPRSSPTGNTPQHTPDRRPTGLSNSVSRALSILGLLNNSQRPLSFSEIQQKLALPKSTTSLLLSTLESLGYLTRDTDNRRYWISPQVYSPKAVPIDHVELTATAVPVLKSISATLRLTTFIGVLDMDQVLFLAKADGPGPATCDVYPGRRASAQCTAVGKVLLAWLDHGELEKFLARHRAIPHTNRTITSNDALLRALSDVRRRGFAIDDREESLSVRCLAVPVADGTIALGVTGSLTEIRPDNIAALVACLRRMAPGISPYGPPAFDPTDEPITADLLQ